MSLAEDYVGGWRRLVGEGIRSYRRVSEDLRDAREYHGSRSFLPPDDRDAGHRGLYVEIPLLWGTF